MSAPQPDSAVAQERSAARVSLDLVIPMYDEAAVLPALLDELARSFSAETRRSHRLASVRCIFVDDGCRDASVSIVRDWKPPGLGVSIVRLSRNFGHQAAISAGMNESSADLVAVMDADLQDPPACVLEMIERWRQGFEVVYARRRSRQEGAARRFFYAAFYRLFRLLSPVDVPVDAGDFSLLSRRVADELNRLPEAVRFPRGLRAWIGFPQTAIDYDRPARAAGTSRYGWRDLYRLATDGLASLSLRPLQIAQVLALVYLVLALVGAGAVLTGWFVADLRTQLLLVTFLMLVSNALILFCVYILGAYLGRAYLETKGRPTYIVADTLRLQEPAADSGPDA